jgi:hypothetical protein
VPNCSLAEVAQVSGVKKSVIIARVLLLWFDHYLFF